MKKGDDLEGYAGLHHEVLAPAELAKLLARMAKARAAGRRAVFLRLRDRIVSTHVRFVLSVARRFRNRGIPLADLVQCGLMGLCRALDTFDPSRGVALSTYATWWVTHRIGRALGDLAHLVRRPVHLQDAIAKVERAARPLRARLGREPTAMQLAKASGLPLARVRKLLALGPASAPPSLDAPAFAGDGEATFVDLLPDERAESPEDALLRRERETEATRLVTTLDERSRAVVEGRFGLNGFAGVEFTLSEIGDEQGVSRERIRQLETKALAAMRGRAARDVLKRERVRRTA